MKKQKLTPKQQNQADKLCQGARKSLKLLFREGSKREARLEHNAAYRNAELEKGVSPENIRMKASPYIHWSATMKQYITDIGSFINWLVITHPETTKIRYSFRKGYAREYIQLHIDAGYSASTIKTYAAALAKLFRCSLRDIHESLPARRSSEFSRSRKYCEAKYSKDVEKYKDAYGPIVEICRCTGVRELELEHLYPECFMEDAGGDLYVHLDGKRQKAKGGKTRDVVIIPANQARMREILETLEPGKLICPVAPSHLDIHGIRSMYATDYYDSIARDICDIPKSERIPLKNAKKDNKRGTVRYDAPGVYRRRDGRKFDRRALLEVSRSLGHGREDVVVASYLR